MRRTSVTVVVLGLAGLVSAQAPIPTIGSAPESLELALPPAMPPVPESAPVPTTARDRVARLETELGTLRERKAEAEATLRTRARALYRIRKSGSIPRQGGFDALLARHGQLERLEGVIVDDLGRLQDYARRVRATSEALSAAKLEAQTEIIQDRLAAERAATQLAYANLGVAELPGIPADPAALAVGEAPGVVPLAVAAATPPTSGFASLRGRLGLPIVSSIGMRDAVRDDGPGIELIARAGTGVIAVAEGRVAFAGDYGSYGRMIILDHGDTFYTIYAGLGTVVVRVGDWVRRGGALADVGGGRNPALFFEVRRGTRSLDTRSWIGVAP